MFKLRDCVQSDKIDWDELSYNPNAIHLLEQNLDKVHWLWLSANPNAIHLLEQNLDKINWKGLSENPNASHLLEQNLDKINWRNLLCCNPGIFEYDYEAMKKTRDPIKHELMIERFNPKHIHQFSSWGF